MANNDNKKISEITLADIIKGLLFIVLLFILFFASQFILGAVSYSVRTLLPNLSSLYLVIVMFVAIAVGILGYGVRTGRPLWLLWEQYFSKKSKKGDS